MADRRRPRPARWSAAVAVGWMVLISSLLAGCGDPAPRTESPRPDPPAAAVAPPPETRGALQPGGPPVTAELAGGATHHWHLDLDAGRFVRAVVLQQGVDVSPALLDPNGALQVAADRPNGTHGPELILAVTERAGRHVLAVRGFAGPAGRYTVAVEPARPAGEADRAFAAAYRRYTGALELPAEDRPRRWAEAVDAARRLGFAELEGEALYRLGQQRFFARDYAGAVERLAAAAAALARAGDPYGEAAARTELGIGLAAVGENERATGELLAGLELARSVDDRHYQARALATLGRIESSWGEIQRALDRYRRALELGSREGLFGATDLHDLGVLLARHLGERREGRELLIEALAAWPPEALQARAVTLGQLGEVELEAGRIGEARKRLEGALALLGEDDVCLAAITGARLARAELAAGEAEAARRRLEAAVATAGQRRCGGAEPTLLLLTADLAGRRSDPAAAHERYRRCRDLFEERRDLWGGIQCRAGVARAEWALGRPEAALVSIDRALEGVEGVRPTLLREDLRTSWFAGARDLYDLRIDLLAAAGRHEEAWLTAERARAQALSDLLIEAGAGLRRDADPGLAARERTLQRRLNELDGRRSATAGASSQRSLEREIDAAIAELQAVRGELRRGPAAAGVAGEPTAAALRARLAEGDLLLEYRLGDARSHLWAVSRESVEGHALPPRAEVERLAREAAAWIESPRWPGRNPRKACELARLLLGPVAGRLDVRRLILVPDGALETLSFAALPEPAAAECDDAPPLVAGRDVAYLPSAAALGALERRLAGRQPSPGGLAVVADPVYFAGDERLDGVAAPPARSPGEGGAAPWPRLVHAEAEAAAILRLLPGSGTLRATGFGASRAAVLDGSLRRYRLIHFATHGQLDPDRPLLSHLALSRFDAAGRPVDGDLYAHEIYGLDLPAELVTLSACETALGREVRGEGLVSGLPRAFLYAGAARVLVSLWEVGDASTRELMTAFYRGLIERRLPPARALREAQLGMIRAGHPPHRWAGFVLQGDLRPLPPPP